MNAGQIATISESFRTNRSYGIRYFNIGQAATIRESGRTNRSYGIREFNVGQSIAVIESVRTNRSYGVRYYGIKTASYQCVSFGFNDGVAVFSAVVYCISVLNGYAFQIIARSESVANDSINRSRYYDAS